MASLDRDTGEQYGAIRFLPRKDSPADVRERNATFLGAVLAHMLLIGVLALSPAPKTPMLPAASTLTLTLETGEELKELVGSFTRAASGSAVGDREIPKPRPDVSASRPPVRLAGVPLPPSAPELPAAPVPPVPAVVQPAVAGAYARDLIERALERGNGTGDQPLGREDIVGGERSVDDLMAGPTTTPYTRAPALLNPGDIQSFLLRKYPSSLQTAGLGGRAVLWLLIDANGEVLKAILHTTSGYAQLDKAALDAVPRMEFSPAVNNGRRVPVWVQQPINFRTY